MVAALALGHTAPDLSAEEVEARALRQRRAIKQGAFVLTSLSRKADGKPRFSREFRIWIDGAKNRTDIIKLDASPSFRQVHCLNCDEGKLVFFSEQPLEGGISVVEVEKKVPAGRILLNIDPRTLGMALSNCGGLCQEHLESALARKDRHPPTVRKAELKGQDCHLLEFTALNGVKYKAWVVPAWDFSVARMEVENGLHPDGVHHFSVECDYRQYGKAGYWYPSSCVYEHRVGDKLDEREVTEVKSASINEPLPPDCFALAGMKVPDRKPIYGLASDGKKMNWDGAKAVAPEALPPLVPAPSRVNRWLVAGSVLLAAAAAGALWLAFRRRAAAR